MRNILLIVFLFTNNYTFSQTQFKHSDVIVVDSTIKKQTLYSNALTWIAYNFKSANNVIQMKDFESGKIIIKGYLQSKPRVWGVSGDGDTRFTLEINIKDGKYKYEYSQIYFPYKAGPSFYYDKEMENNSGKKSHKEWKEQVDIELKELTESLKKEIIKQSDF